LAFLSSLAQWKTIRAHSGVAPYDPAEDFVSGAKCRLAADVARHFGEVRLRVTGLSMLPCLSPGDIVTVKRCGIEDFQPGEIAKYLREERLFAHRVIGFQNGKLITRGDTMRENDLPVDAGEIVGKVISVERGGEIFQPSRSPKWGESAIAGIARRSALALRLLSLFYNRRPATSEQAALCEN
jgi:signal peptidase I